MLEKTGGKLGPVVEYPSYPEACADLANKRLDYVINVVISVNDLAKAKPKVFAKGLAVSGPCIWRGRSRKTLAAAAGLYDQVYEPHEGDRQARRAAEKWFGETYDNLPTEAITSPEQFLQTRRTVIFARRATAACC